MSVVRTNIHQSHFQIIHFSRPRNGHTKISEILYNVPEKKKENIVINCYFVVILLNHINQVR